VTSDEERAGHGREPLPGFLVLAGLVLCGGCAGAVEDAGGGADVHFEGGADVGVPGHAGHVGGVELPGEPYELLETYTEGPIQGAVDAVILPSSGRSYRRVDARLSRAQDVAGCVAVLGIQSSGQSAGLYFYLSYDI
jgi:hypothetical protein